MGRILGVDYGEIRIGLALSDKTKRIAFPFKTIKNKNIDVLLDFFRKLNFEKNIDSIVIGLPLGMNGKDTLQTKNVRIFSKSLSIPKVGPTAYKPWTLRIISNTSCIVLIYV